MERERKRAAEQGVQSSGGKAEGTAMEQFAEGRTNGIAGRVLSITIRVLIVTLLILVTAALMPTRG